MGRFLVGKTSEIKVGQMKKISIDEKDVVIANFDGNFFAVDDTCTHAGASLSEGKLDDSTITCLMLVLVFQKESWMTQQ